MTTRLWKLLGAIAGSETGRECRACGQPIATRDAFGVSEGVCRACRVELDR